MDEQIKTSVGKIFSKYNKDTDSFDMIRILRIKEDGIFYRALDSKYNFVKGIELLKADEFKENFENGVYKNECQESVEFCS